jgi:HSP20 family protein
MIQIKDLVEKGRGKDSKLFSLREEHPFSLFREQINRLFDDFLYGRERAPLQTAESWYGSFQPSIDVRENEKEITVSAELPGLDDKDIEVLLSGDALTIKGEKKEEKEEKEKNYYRMERRYGSFHRVIPLPVEIDTKKADATFKKGILHVKLPKAAKAKSSAKKINVKSEK